MNKKVILITGATDGIGLETARELMNRGQHILIHGRNSSKLKRVEDELSNYPGNGIVESYLADLSNLEDVQKMVNAIKENHETLDVVINNAGVFKTKETQSKYGLDIRFVVNTVSPYLLSKELLPLISKQGRVVNLSSAAQAPVDLEAMQGKRELSDFEAYAQSKLAITMWSRTLAEELRDQEIVVVSVNPASMLGSKMVKEGFGVDGGDIKIGSDILIRAALSEEFSDASGKYYDNDHKCFAPPHADALDTKKSVAVKDMIEKFINDHS